MAESVAARAQRILSGNIADLMDRMTRAPAESVVKDTIHEIDQVIGEAQVKASQAATSRRLALREAQMIRQEIAGLMDRAREALKQSRDDLAHAAVTRQLDLEARLIVLADAERDAANAETAMEHDIAALSMRKRDMRESLDALIVSNRANEIDPARAPVRQVENAVETFSRSMMASSGDDRRKVASIHATRADKLAELDVILRREQVADRVDALKKQVADRLAAMKAAM